MTELNAGRTPNGVHVSRGIALRIPAGALTIAFDSDGRLEARIQEVHLQLNTCTDWLEIALEHLRCAKSAHSELLSCVEHGAGKGASAALRAEFLSSMQACVAAATFFEALYAAAREGMPDRLLAPKPESGRSRSRARHVAEQLRRSFGLKQAGTKQLREWLGYVYKLRNEAVHPNASFGNAVLHPQLQVGVERRFVVFGFESARNAVRGALAHCEIFPVVAGVQGPKETVELCDYLRASGAPLCAAWRAEFGKLRDDEVSGPDDAPTHD